jgi:short-subunit dehydrogenase
MEDSMNQGIPSFNAVITGASSGIGWSLALMLAKEGCTLGLIGRNTEALSSLAAKCRQAGAIVELGVIDVRDCASLQSWIRHFDERHPIDWFIANAGMSASIQEGRHLEQIEEAHQVIHTNLMGVIDSMDAIVPLMCGRNRGQIGLVSSLAALRGMALTPVYSASKAGVKAYGEALRDLLAPSGVGVSIICPGFVETPMSDRFPGPRPQMLSPERAAQKITRGLERNQAYIDFPWHFAFGLRLLSILPFGVGSFMLRLLSLQAK